jgi:hypothetical protein
MDPATHLPYFKDPAGKVGVSDRALVAWRGAVDQPPPPLSPQNRAQMSCRV